MCLISLSACIKRLLAFLMLHPIIVTLCIGGNTPSTGKDGNYSGCGTDLYRQPEDQGDNLLKDGDGPEKHGTDTHLKGI